MIKLTKLESTVYAAINTAIQDSDNVDLHDICMETDMEISRVRGVVASLTKKGLVINEISENDGEEVVTYKTRTIEEVEADMQTQVIEQPTKEKKVTKASLMREEIAKLKATMTKEEAQDQIIQWAMETLGQTKQLAKVYFTENWDKV